MASVKHWIWLSAQEALSPVAKHQLIAHFGDAETVFYAQREDYLAAGKFSKIALDGLCQKDLTDTELMLAQCDRYNVRLITMQDSAYPDRLRQIADPPIMLYARGKWRNLDEEILIGMVGTRRATPYGMQAAGQLAWDICQQGGLVISGIADGIDTAALRGCLDGEGFPVSVLPCGIDVVYPRSNEWLLGDIASRGLLLTELAPGAQVRPDYFQYRNRIISGLSVGILVVEAAERSGTNLTVHAALEQSKDIFAVPGGIDAEMSRGPNLLIREGAKPVLRAEDIMEEYALRFPHKLRPRERQGVRPRLISTPVKTKEKETRQEKTVDKSSQGAYISIAEAKEGLSLNEHQLLILQALQSNPLQSEQIVEQTGIPAAQVMGALTLLMLDGHVEELSGRRFQARLAIKN